MKPLFLIGSMGAGKTTLGRALEACEAESPMAGIGHRPLRYIDLDEFIERRRGCSVREIFEAEGEAAFRRLESEALREVAEADDVIIGCGGGTPCTPGNMEWMNARGITVRLQASPGVLLRRLLEAQGQRPLLQGMSETELAGFIDRKQREREPWYSQARITFPSDLLESEEEIAASCAAFRAMTERYLIDVKTEKTEDNR